MFNRIQEARIKLAKKILPEGYHVSKNNPKGGVRKSREAKAEYEDKLSIVQD